MRIAIAEDNPEDAAKLRIDVMRFAGESGQAISADVFSTGAELLEHFHSQYDLLLLDVDMPAMDELETARAIRRRDSEVLIMFITNLAQYAINGYGVRALGYLLEQVGYYALSMKLEAAFRLLRRNAGQSLSLNRDGDVFHIPLSHLFYI